MSAVVTFLPSGATVTVPEGWTLFRAAQKAGLPVAAACNAEFICGKCNVTVVKGHENLTPQSEGERSLLRRENRPETDRISCRARVLGDCTITTAYW